MDCLLFILSTNFKENFNEEKDKYIGWQIITPPSRNEDDDDKLMAMSQWITKESIEKLNIKNFHPDLFSKNHDPIGFKKIR